MREDDDMIERAVNEPPFQEQGYRVGCMGIEGFYSVNVPRWLFTFMPGIGKPAVHQTTVGQVYVEYNHTIPKVV